MIPLPEWAPNAHPLIVHFPIALLFSAALFDLIALIARDWGRSREIAGALYVLGALAVIVTYFTGQAAADSVRLPSAAQTVLTDHADWATRTVWFYGLYGVVRLALLKLRPTQVWVSIVVFLIGAGGLILVVETGTRGAEMVFRYGVGVQAVEGAPSSRGTPGSMTDGSEAAALGFMTAADGSWEWSVRGDADDVLQGRADFLTGTLADLDTVLQSDSVLSLQISGGPVLFVLGDSLESIEATAELDLDQFDGVIRLAHHVVRADHYDFLELTGSRIRQGRLESGEPVEFDSATFSPQGRFRLTAVSDGGHFRGYVGDKMLVHGHSDPAEPGRVGLYLHGTGTVGLRHIGVNVLRQNDH